MANKKTEDEYLTKARAIYKAFRLMVEQTSPGILKDYPETLEDFCATCRADCILIIKKMQSAIGGDVEILNSYLQANSIRVDLASELLTKAMKTVKG